MTYAPYACIAYPCTADRAEGSAYCEEHKAEGAEISRRFRERLERSLRR